MRNATTPDVTAGPPDNRIEVASSPDSAEHGTALETVLERYRHVGLRTKPSKVKDYDAVQDLVGHTLDHNVLRASSSRFAAIRNEVLRLLRCRWARPRDIERLVGKLTNVMFLHRQSLSIFNAAYAFCRTTSPEQPRRLWPSVRQELSDAVALLPLFRSDLSRPVATQLLQTDACDTGAAVVYTDTVNHAALRQECARPRRTARLAGEPTAAWSAAADLGAEFDTSVEPIDWHVAVRCTYPATSRVRHAHINEKEAGALVLAIRWAARSRRTRRCRLVIQRFRSRCVRDAKRALLTARDEAALQAARGADARTWDHRGVPMGCDGSQHG